MEYLELEILSKNIRALKRQMQVIEENIKAKHYESKKEEIELLKSKIKLIEKEIDTQTKIELSETAENYIIDIKNAEEKLNSQLKIFNLMLFDDEENLLNAFMKTLSHFGYSNFELFKANYRNAKNEIIDVVVIANKKINMSKECKPYLDDFKIKELEFGKNQGVINIYEEFVYFPLEIKNGNMKLACSSEIYLGISNVFPSSTISTQTQGNPKMCIILDSLIMEIIQYKMKNNILNLSNEELDNIVNNICGNSELQRERKIKAKLINW